MKTIILVVCAVSALSGLAAGQNSDYKKGEFFVGASITGLDDGGNDRRGLKGFEASGVYNLNRYFGIKGDVSAGFDKKRRSLPVFGTSTLTYDDRHNLWNFLGGVQFKDNAKRGIFKPFAHALVGAGHNFDAADHFSCTGTCTGIVENSNSHTGLAAAFGGGIDLRVNNRIQIRAIQIDYNPVKYEIPNYPTNTVLTQHNIRLSAGIVF